MFDIGWLELIIIGIVALIVVGPKDLPMMFQTVGRFMGRMRGMAREFQRSMEDAANESGMKDAANTIRKAADPLNEATRAAQRYAKSAMDEAVPKDALDDMAAAPAPKAEKTD